MYRSKPSSSSSSSSLGLAVVVVVAGAVGGGGGVNAICRVLDRRSKVRSSSGSSCLDLLSRTLQMALTPPPP